MEGPTPGLVPVANDPLITDIALPTPTRTSDALSSTSAFAGIADIAAESARPLPKRTSNAGPIHVCFRGIAGLAIQSRHVSASIADIRHYTSGKANREA